MFNSHSNGEKKELECLKWIEGFYVSENTKLARLPKSKYIIRCFLAMGTFNAKIYFH